MPGIAERFSLKGRTALVTGSSRGIGRAIATGFAEAGARVVVHGRRPGPALEEAARACRGAWVAADLAAPDETSAMAARFPDIDILVLNASAQSYTRIEDFDEALFMAQCQANLGSTFRLIRDYAPGMSARGWGRIILIGSVNQMRPAERFTTYSAMKAALLNLTRNAAKSLAPTGVTVNNIAPGVVETDRNAEALADAAFAHQVKAQVPAGYFAQPEDCVGAALLLASEAGRYITGVELPVTGGMDL